MIVLLWSQFSTQFCRWYCVCDLTDDVMDSSELRDFNHTPTFNREKPTLHEILMAEKSEFEAKVQRAARRKKWLKGMYL